VDTKLIDDLCRTSAGDCSLRAAIQQVNYSPGADIIIVPAGTYPLQRGELRISSSMILRGDGSKSTTIDGRNTQRLIRIDKDGVSDSIDVTVRGLTLVNGNVADEGGAIWNDEKTTLTDVRILNNRAAKAGGGCYNEAGTLTIRQSFIRENTVTAAEYSKGGGAIYSEYGTVVLSDTRVISNTLPSGAESLAYGAGIYAYASELSVYRSIFRGNEIVMTKRDHFVDGAAINLFDGSTLLMEDSVIEKNRGISRIGFTEGLSGIAIFSSISDITLRKTIIRDNETSFTFAGVVSTGGNLVMESSAILNNRVPEGVSGLYFNSSNGSARIINSTISGNTAETGTLAGTRFDTGEVEIINSTISGNRGNTTSIYSGQDLWVDQGANVTVSHSTISNTLTTQSILVRGSNTLKFKNSIIAGICIGNFVSLGNNVIPSLNGCTYTQAKGDIVGQDAGLAGLANNGGSTSTHALLPGSPAINRGICLDPWGNPVVTDQRGHTRIRPCDIGAFESYSLEGLVPVYLPLVSR
jgi:hypothetical protein